MEIVYFQESIPEQILKGIQIVHELVFEGSHLKESKLEGKKGLLCYVAIENGAVVGFKLGYEVEDEVFFSWLGGVNPSFQKRGIASSLMRAQHTKCGEIGYKKVRTFSRNMRKSMLILNLKCGFDIIETFIDEKGRHKIILEKVL